MIDIKLIRDNPQNFRKSMKGRITEKEVEEILKIDAERKEKLKKIEELRAKQKKAQVTEARKIKDERRKLEEEFKKIDEKWQKLLSEVPNIPDEDVPSGDAEKNVVVTEVGEVEEKESLPHWEIGKILDILDFETASKISQSFFPMLKGDGARLEFALMNFFLEENEKYGFEPVCVPYLVNEGSVFGTGQLPKFKDELYHIEKDNLYLIPTGEVPAGNFFKDKILNEKDLPLRFQIPTPCFRREAGSWGKLGKGLIRNHQFHKVEIFSFTKPEDSNRELEQMVKVVSEILKKLALPHRIILLSSLDMGFSASKTYDIEIWMNGLKRWVEVSSISNCRDFQTRRTKTRFKTKEGLKFPHSLNGSSLAVGRVFAGILENYWDKENAQVNVPDCLKKFIKKDRIERG
ncbi:MAG: serine--tRNA ligase [Elusimicrobia bacterium]|nr:serine--tRNA ligase [Elusimicrobiota bacterium]